MGLKPVVKEHLPNGVALVRSLPPLPSGQYGGCGGRWLPSALPPLHRQGGWVRGARHLLPVFCWGIECPFCWKEARAPLWGRKEARPGSTVTGQELGFASRQFSALPSGCVAFGATSFLGHCFLNWETWVVTPQLLGRRGFTDVVGSTRPSAWRQVSMATARERSPRKRSGFGEESLPLGTSL